MKLIIKDRGMGKTTQLIYTSETTGYPIATMSTASIAHIKEMAIEMGCDIPEPITYNDLINRVHRGNKLYDNILIDDADFIIQKALSAYLNSDVKGVTLTNMKYAR